jgi:hypothetical protein
MCQKDVGFPDFELPGDEFYTFGKPECLAFGHELLGGFVELGSNPE